ncbi:MAG: MATE family efflux transporter [Sphingobium sp.]
MIPRATIDARTVWALALPAMLTNVATALFGLADMWVIGQVGDAAQQGAVEMGARFMTSLLVSFNFLRTGTVALTAQAGFNRESRELATTLIRAMLLALAIAIIMLASKPLIVPFGLRWLDAQGTVAGQAETYIALRYWACPAVLANAVLIGWLVGQRRVRLVLACEVGTNILHIALDLWLVLVWHWGVQGVASASAVSEWLKLALLAALACRRGFGPGAAPGEIWKAAAFRRLLAMNRDLFLRTLLLTGVMLLFTRAGARSGAVTLAANGILFQMVMLSALILDGFETAAQILCGEAKGQGRRSDFVAAARANLLWGWLCGGAVALAYALFGQRIAASFTLDPAVRATAAAQHWWVVALPILGVTSFVMDGIFVGAAWTRAMLLTMAVAFGAFHLVQGLAQPLGNSGLWLAFSLFFVVRGLGQMACMPALLSRDFGRPGA